MKFRSVFTSPLMFLFTFALLVQSAKSTTVFDTNLVSPNTNPSTPGWYNGTGNPNGGFTVDNENGIELGLRAKLRQSPNVIDSLTNLYNVPTGEQPGSSTRAIWNYEFSIDLEPQGFGMLTLSDITALLTISDVTTGKSVAIDPLSYFPDDSGFGAGGKTSSGLIAGQWGAQNSENPQFASFPLTFLNAEPYDPNAVRLYQFDLTVNQGATQLATDTIQVQTVVPEPSTFGLLLGGLAMCALSLRRRRSRA
jgi:hypothetical protein